MKVVLLSVIFSVILVSFTSLAFAEFDALVLLETNSGNITIELFPNDAPNHVENFMELTQSGFYDNTTFHRIIKDFMIQGGCPLGTGTGDPGYKFADEFVAELRHDAPGKLSMANAGPGTNGSQFFITHVPTPWLDDAHTLFGAVQSEADQTVVNAIAQGDTVESIVIEGDADTFLGTVPEVDAWNTLLDG